MKNLLLISSLFFSIQAFGVSREQCLEVAYKLPTDLGRYMMAKECMEKIPEGLTMTACVEESRNFSTPKMRDEVRENCYFIFQDNINWNSCINLANTMELDKNTVSMSLNCLTNELLQPKQKKFVLNKLNDKSRYTKEKQEAALFGPQEESAVEAKVVSQ